MKNLLFLFCLLTYLNASAERVTKEEAREKAVSFLSSKTAKARTTKNQSSQNITAAEVPSGNAFYIFNVGSEDGFVIVSGDDRTPEILGYTEHGHYDTKKMPTAMKTLLENYAKEINQIHAVFPATRKTVSGNAIAPLLTSQWDQGAPFNMDCPITPEEDETWTGCVATAMAQVMYYHKWPANTTQPIPGYVTYSWGFERPEIAVTAIDWDNMLPVYDDQATSTQKEAVAKLMVLCGTSLQMDYDPEFSGAGTPSIPPALINYFDYDRSMKMVGRAAYKLVDWNQLIYDELAAGRPVIYNGASSGGAHAFVIDGYDKDDLFHVNWGWGGWCDGHFLLSVLDPQSNTGAGASSSTDGYSFWQGAIIGIHPQMGTQPEPLRLSSYHVWADDATVDLENGDRIGSWHCSLINENEAGLTWDHGWGCFDTTGQLLWIAQTDENNDIAGGWNDTNSELYFKPTFGMTHFTPEDIPEGNSIIKPVSRLSGTETWMPNHGTDKSYITMNRNGNILTFATTIPEEPVINLSGSIEAVGTVIVNKPVTVRATINNNGTDFIGDVFFFTNDEMIGGKCIDVDAGGTTTVEFTFTPTLLGNLKLSLSRDYDDSSNPFVTGELSITGPKANLSIVPTIVNAYNDVIGLNRAIINLHITNNGDAPYDNEIYTDVFKIIDGGEEWMGEPTATISLAAGESTDVEVVFTNVEDGASYYANVAYISESSYLLGNQRSAIFSVKYSDANLSTTASVKNSVNNIVHSNRAIINVHLDNNISNDYNDMVFVRIYKYRNDGSNYGDLAGAFSKMVSVPANGTADVTVEFKDVEHGAGYFTIVKYVSAGDETLAETRIEEEFLIDLTPLKGDANGDGIVNAADIVEILNAIMGCPSKLFNENNADSNSDGVVNATDIVHIVNNMMNQ